MALTIALISIGLLGAILLLLSILVPQTPIKKLLLAIYGFNLLFETSMVITGLNGIKNHFMVNIHSLVFGYGMLLILLEVWKNILSKKISNTIIFIAFAFYFFVWLSDNFFLHNFLIFNPLSQAIIFLVNFCLVIYLLNVLLFIKKSNHTQKVYIFIIIAFIVHCFSCLIIDNFFNYYIELPKEVYKFISRLGMGLGIVAHLFILLAVIWMSKTRKYTLQ